MKRILMIALVLMVAAPTFANDGAQSANKPEAAISTDKVATDAAVQPKVIKHEKKAVKKHMKKKN